MREGVVLVVDDEAMVEDMINTILSRHGYRTASFGDSGNALQFFREHHDIIDLVVTDFNIPHIRGGQLARKMAEINPEIPVILITGYMGDLREDDCAPNVKIVLEKPMSRELFVRAVDTLARR